jgi:hypothetical protein
VAEVLVQFTDPVVSQDGETFLARACGAEAPDTRWQGWIEFLPVDGGEVLRTGRETTQPNRADALYWATGLTAVYLEGALERARRPLTISHEEAPIVEPAYDGPAPEARIASTPADSILNPFSVYRKGERLLRSQLAALSPWHLVNIVRAHGLSDADPSVLSRMDGPTLIDLIVDAVRREVETTASSQ